MPSRRRLFSALVPPILLVFAGPVLSASPPKTEVLVEAFEAAAFGVEIPGFLGGRPALKRFEGPVRVFVESAAAKDRSGEIARFVSRADREIAGLSIAIANSMGEANFVVHVVDGANYQRAGRRIFRNPFLSVPGQCIVRVGFGRAGIRRSDALIVSDAGEAMVRRCIAEEILQGLGLLADTAILGDSVFNDASAIERPTRADRILVEMLYDPRLRSGMAPADARPFLTDVAKDARRRRR